MRAPLSWALLVALLLPACSPPEGERRPLKVHYEGPQPAPVRVEGEEVFFGGNWVKDGPTVFYDKSGNVTHRGDYKLGFEDGPWTELGPDGTTGTGPYDNGERHGEWSYHYASGELQSTGRYHRGKRTGKWLRYYSDGSLEAEMPYKDGLLEGVVLVYDETGTKDPEASGTFRDGERIR